MECNFALFAIHSTVFIHAYVCLWLKIATQPIFNDILTIVDNGMPNDSTENEAATH